MSKDNSLIPLTKKRLSDVARETLEDYLDKMRREGKSKLPPETELAQSLGVSRTTIRKTLSDLENRGDILRIHGKGTFINLNDNQVRLNFTSGLPLLTLIRNCGYEPSAKVLYHLKSETAPFQQAALKLNENDIVLTVCRLYYADNIPVILLIDDIPEKILGDDFLEEYLNDSTYNMLRKHAGITCTREEVRISSASSSAVKAFTEGKTYFDSDSLLELNIIACTERNVPVFLSKQYYNTRYLQFHMLRLLDA